MWSFDSIELFAVHSVIPDDRIQMVRSSPLHFREWASASVVMYEASIISILDANDIRTQLQHLIISNTITSNSSQKVIFHFDMLSLGRNNVFDGRKSEYGGIVGQKQ